MPLPLRDYYPIGRAAELLECTIDDLLCWGYTDCIRLCVKLESVRGLFCIDDFSYFCKNIIKDLNLVSSHCECSDDATKNIAIILKYFIENKNVFLKEIENKYYYPMIYQLVECKNPDSNGSVENTFDRLIKLGGLKDKIDYQNINDFYDGGNDSINIPVYLNGFFALNDNFYEDIENESKTGVFKLEYVETYNYLLTILLEEEVEFNFNDIFVLKDDFIKIKNASKTGGELSKIQLNKNYNHKEKYQEVKTTRNSLSSITIAKALIINYLPDLKNNPAKLAGVLEKEIKKAKLGDFTVSKDTISRWMKED
ncbi:hypothetical protein RYQ88_000099 [Salmonella enterica]|nr:hypothetical protein [Salmonella enterica]ELM3428665.1 hypothetical protein [Salmonella enterica]